MTDCDWGGLAANINEPGGLEIYLDALLVRGLGPGEASAWRGGVRLDGGSRAGFLRSVLGNMVEVPAGSYLQGTPDAVRTRPEERPRLVTISRPFLLGRTQVTQGLWSAVRLTGQGETP